MKKINALLLRALIVLFLVANACVCRAQHVLATPTGVYVAGGAVCASAYQSDGKLVVGGKFVAINGVPRNNIARLNVDGSVDLAWDPGAETTDYVNCVVSALAVYGNVVYIAGSFDTTGGLPRNRIAALDVTTGLATPWDPGTASPPWTVNALALAENGNTVYVGGAFGNIGGAARTNLAAISASDGGALPLWSADTDGPVAALAVSGNVLYVGGSFMSIGGQSRNYLAALDADDASVSNWAPNLDYVVYTVTVSGSNLYVGGAFTHVGGSLQPYVVALDRASGSTINWNPGISFKVDAIAVSGSTVYLGGGTPGFYGYTTGQLVAADATSGTLKNWNPEPDGYVMTLATAGSTVFAGGLFVNMGGNLTGGFANIDAVTAVSVPNQLSGYSGTVAALQSQSDGKVIVGGAFTAVGAVPRNNLARLNQDGSVDNSWDPNPDADVSTLLVYGSSVYVGGDFLNIGTHFRQRLAAIDLNTGIATAWQPDPDYPVSAIAATDNAVFVGGYFSYVGNGLHPNLAQLDMTTGLASNWTSNADQPVTCLATSGTTLYVGGFFRNIGGQSRQYLAALDIPTGTATSWDPSPDNLPRVLLVDSDAIYVGGSFINIGSALRQGIAAIDVTTGLATDWDANPSLSGAEVYSIIRNGNNIIFGGQFDYTNGGYEPNLAAADIATGAAPLWSAPVFRNGSTYGPVVSALVSNGDVLFVGGNFQRVSTTTRGSLAAVDPPDLIFKDGFQ